MTPSAQNEYIPVEDAIQRIGDTVQFVTETQLTASKDAETRVLAGDLKAQRDIPAFDNSAMDGYLFLTKDLDEGRRTFKIAEEIRPEDDQPLRPEPATCREIMTGAPVPAGSVTVVPVEMTERSGEEVTVIDIPGRNPIRQQGEGYKQGKVVLTKGVVLRPYEVGLMIESGNLNCRVMNKIRIGVQVTGSEIDENRNSNGPVLHALVRHWPGADVKEWPVVEDDFELINERMLMLKDSSDLVLTTGGISMGKHDYILEAMKELGAEVIVRRVQQKPGKPLTVTKLDGTLFFHLPGNPISAVFTAEYYARKALFNMLGLTDGPRTALAAHALENHRKEKTLFIPGKLQLDQEHRLTVTSKGVMKSHLMQLYRDSDVYIRLDPETKVAAGDPVHVTPYSTNQLP